jgi:hypothetical protein
MDSTFLMFAVVMLVIFIGGIIIYKRAYNQRSSPSRLL